MRIAIVGSGYVGLVTGACFAEFGVHVTSVDKDAAKIAALQKGQIPIYEPGLETLIQRNIEKRHLSYTTDLKAAVRDADVVFIAVGTPSLTGASGEGRRGGEGQADLTYVFQAAEEIAHSLTGYTVIVTKSTVPVDTGRKIYDRIQKANPQAEFDVASNPEFLREGSAIEDFMRPDRVVIGAETKRAKEMMRTLYRPLYLIETPIVFTSLESAELIKYASNALLATKIAFINEIADLCEKCGADIQDVAKGTGLDRRIGSKFLHAGPGFGGSCFPKDTRALVQTADQYGTPSRIVTSVVASNEARKKQMAKKIFEACGGSVKGKRIGILGMTFKPNTDDMRESASLDIVPALLEGGAKIQAFDPQGMEEAAKLLPAAVTWCKDAYASMDGAEALVILTEWNEFRALDLHQAKSLLRTPLIIDLRNIYSPADVAKAGLTYHSIGRAISMASDFERAKGVAA